MENIMKQKWNKRMRPTVVFARLTGVTVFLSTVFSFFSLNAGDPQGHIIQFDNFSYNPNQLDVAVGDTIIWQGDFVEHPLQSSSVPDGAQHWGPIDSGTEFRYVVEVDGTYNYQCNLHDDLYGMTGSFTATVTSVNERAGDIPELFRLEQNYPNPFNPSTEIQFALQERMQVMLEVYAIHGQKIATLVDGMRNAGHHSVIFDATGIPSGVYIYRLQSDQKVQAKRMVYIR